jgi:hypothetical protein
VVPYKVQLRDQCQVPATSIPGSCCPVSVIFNLITFVVAGSWNTVTGMMSRLQAGLPIDTPWLNACQGKRFFSFLYQSGRLLAHSSSFPLPPNSLVNLQIKTINQLLVLLFKLVILLCYLQDKRIKYHQHN